MKTPDLVTSLVALYTITDDTNKMYYYQETSKPGFKDKMSDSEIITIAIWNQWLKLPERKLISYIRNHWLSFFPKLISQSEFNRRLHSLANRLPTLMIQITKQMKAYIGNYEVFDCVPVPLMKRCRGEKTKLFKKEIANIGRGGSDLEWFYGVKLGLAVGNEGLVNSFIISPAKTSERWSAEYLLCYRNNPSGNPIKMEDLPPSHGKKRVGPDGTIWPKEGISSGNPLMYLVDRGFNGEWWEQHWEIDYNTIVLNPDSYEKDDTDLKHLHSSLRQVIETVNDHLSYDLGLNRIGARSVEGLLARIAAKLLAFNIGILLNRLFGRPDFAIATLFSC